MNPTILCSNNELSDRLAEIRSRGGRVWSMDVERGGYALHVSFGRVAEEPQSARDRNPDAGNAGPASPTNYGHGSAQISAHQTANAHSCDGRPKAEAAALGGPAKVCSECGAEYETDACEVCAAVKRLGDSLRNRNVRRFKPQQEARPPYRDD
jgi:hypothetical protein